MFKSMIRSEWFWVRVALFGLLAVVLLTAGIRITDWQYWACMIILFLYGFASVAYWGR